MVTMGLLSGDYGMISWLLWESPFVNYSILSRCCHILVIIFPSTFETIRLIGADDEGKNDGNGNFEIRGNGHFGLSLG